LEEWKDFIASTPSMAEQTESNVFLAVAPADERNVHYWVKETK
jgi:hypothetical protein